MSRLYLSILALFVIVIASASVRDSSYLNYIQNKGQWDKKIFFEAEFRGGRIFLEKNAYTFLCYPQDGLRRLHSHEASSSDHDSIFNFHSFRMEFDGGSSSGIEAAGKKNYYYNYFRGNQSEKWASEASAYAAVCYKDIYPGISVKTFGRGNNVRFDFIVSPAADPSQIKLKFNGSDDLSLRNGKLIISTSVGTIEMEAPFAYQDIDGVRKNISCHYILSNNILKIEITGKYDKSKTLVIDPTLIFATYTGSQSDNWGMTATYDAAGNAYTAGITFGPNYPVTTGAFQVIFASGNSISMTGAFDIVVSKFNSTGSSLLYSTYLGGSGNESPQSIVVDNGNNLFLLGRTFSSDFPVTSGAFDLTLGGTTDMIISKFNPSGTALLASTYVGGTGVDAVNVSAGYNFYQSLKFNYADDARGEILVDNNNNVYVGSCTNSSDFPVTPGCLQQSISGMQDGCVFKMDPQLSAMIYSTYLGGSQNDAVYNLALDSKKQIYASGGTESSNFPVTSGALNGSYMGSVDGFVSHLSFSGNVLLHSTYAGTSSYEQCYFVETDKYNNVYLYGQCSGNYPVTAGVYTNPAGGQFIHGMDSSLSVTNFSTVFGSGDGTPDIVPSAFMVDNCENIYISGWGSSLSGGTNICSTNGLPVTSNAFMTTTDGDDFYFLVLDKNAAALSYATYFGGSLSEEHVDGGTSRFDKSGVIYQAICESCGGFDDMPATPGVWSSLNGSGNCNNALVKFKFDMTATVALVTTTPAAASGCAPLAVQFGNNSINAVSYFWDFDDGNTSTGFAPSHTFDSAGVYQVMLVVTDSSTCNMADTAFVTVNVYDLNLSTAGPMAMCGGDSVQLFINGPSTAAYSWAPASLVSNPSISNPIAFPQVSTQFTVTVTELFCNVTDSVNVQVNTNQTQIAVDSSNLCVDDTVALAANTLNASYAWNTGATTQILQTDSAGLYILTATDNNGCVATDSVTVLPFGYVPALPFDTAICSGNPVQLITTQGPFVYQWTPSASLDSATVYNPVATPMATTVYTVTIGNGPCTSSETYTVNVFPAPAVSAQPESVFILPGESVQLIAVSTDTCFWSPPTGLSCIACTAPVATPDTSSVYYVTVSNAGNCSATDSVMIYVLPSFYVPNAFTPDEDDVNEIFRPVFSGYAELDVWIYDRWGEEIYHYNKLDGGWDGTYKGKPAEIGVYVYKIKAVDVSGKKLTKVGHVTLVR